MAGNQYQPDPRQAEFLANYLNPKSPTFANALQSGLKAGFSQEYSENITHLMPDWLSDAIGDLKRLHKAEKVLEEMLELDSSEPSYVKVKQDTAKFVAERLGKQKYSTKTENEQTGTIQVNVTNYSPEELHAERISASVPPNQEKV